jgi:peptidoglycan biosynthesis protein MviN/MurJ (putative lipid II flippase)
MDPGGVTTLGDVLPYYLVGVPAFGALLVLVRAHVAAQNSRIMVKIGLLNAALNFLGNAILGKLYGLAGLALSTSLVHAAIAGLLYVLLQKHLDEVEADRP